MVKIGTEWIQSYGGTVASLQHTKAQTEGFRTALLGNPNVQNAFVVGGQWTSDEHFEEGPSESELIERADIVYFSGHGSTAGPIFRSPSTGNDRAALTTEIRWGNAPGSLLKYVVLDCCFGLGTSPSLYTTVGSDTVERWAGSFRGVRQVLGFRTACSDESLRGQTFGEYLAAGETIRAAWRKACQETEDSTYQYALLRTSGSLNDRLGSATGPAAPSATLYYEWGAC